MPAKAKLTTRNTATTTVTADNLAKGTELSFNEADSNFINLRDQSIAISDGTTTTDIEAGETITFSGASVSGNTVSITGGGGDLGDLQVNGTTLSPITTNDNLNLVANGTGVINVQDFSISSTEIKKATSFEIKTTDNNQNILIQPGPDGSSDYQFIHLDSKTIHVGQDNTNVRINAASGRGDFDIQNGASVDRGGGTQNSGFHNRIRLTDNLDGEIQIQYANNKWLQVGDLAAQGGVIKLQDNLISTMRSNDNLELGANGAGSVVIKNDLILPSIDIRDNTITATKSNDNLAILPSGSGNVIISGLRFPNADGSNGQVLQTDGAGNITFADLSTGTSVFGGFTAVDTTLSSDITNSDITIDPNGTGKIVLSADLQIGGKIFTGGSAITLAPDTTSTVDLSTNGEPFISLTPVSNGGNIEINVDEGKYLILRANGYGAGTTYGITMSTTNGINLVPYDSTRVNFVTATSATIGSNGAASALTANPVGYLKIKVNGTEYQLPYYNI
jgi:hypothetical protein